VFILWNTTKENRVKIAKDHIAENVWRYKTVRPDDIAKEREEVQKQIDFWENLIKEIYSECKSDINT